MTEHPEPEPTPSTPVPAAADWDDVFRSDETSVEGYTPTEATATRVSPEALVLLAELADPRQRHQVVNGPDRDRLTTLIVLGYLTTPQQGLDLTERGLAALDAVHVGAHGDYIGLDAEGVWRRPHPAPTPAARWGWDQ